MIDFRFRLENCRGLTMRNFGEECFSICKESNDRSITYAWNYYNRDSRYCRELLIRHVLN